MSKFTTPIDDMPMLDFTPDPNETKMFTITRELRTMGYPVGIARDAVDVIEHEGIQKFNFDYPYGSFKEFKKHTLAGEFDPPEDLPRETKEEKEKIERFIKERKLWVRH